MFEEYDRREIEEKLQTRAEIKGKLEGKLEGKQEVAKNLLALLIDTAIFVILLFSLSMIFGSSQVVGIELGSSKFTVTSFNAVKKIGAEF